MQTIVRRIQTHSVFSTVNIMRRKIIGLKMGNVLLAQLSFIISVICPPTAIVAFSPLHNPRKRSDLISHTIWDNSPQNQVPFINHRSTFLMSSSLISPNPTATPSTNHKFKIRTITAFVKIDASDLQSKDGKSSSKTILDSKIATCANLLQNLQSQFEKQNYEVQTVRIATNPFAEYLLINDDPLDVDKKSQVQDRLQQLDSLLAQHDIQFCSLGPSKDPIHTRQICPMIIESSPRFSCSADVSAIDLDAAEAAAECILTVSHLESKNYLMGGLGNFRFCSASSCRNFIPFFPGAKCESLYENKESSIFPKTSVGFALGLENGELIHDLLSQSKSISNIKSTFGQGIVDAFDPLEKICENFVNEYSSQSNIDSDYSFTYLGIDNSLNPSLSHDGSIAKAIETLDEVQIPFGEQGTLAAAAAITTTLQSLPLKLTGYCGLMLPVCEDQRLSELGKNSQLTISQLLCISSVCGVGVDTVPVPGDLKKEKLQGLILDVAALASRWDKSLSCRVFPVPDLKAGDITDFDSPHLCNSCVFNMS